MASFKKTYIFQAVNNQKPKNGSGEDFPKVLYISGSFPSGGENKKGKETGQYSAQKRRNMVFIFHPLFHEDNDKHGSHDEIKPLCIKVEQGATDGAQSTHIDAVGHTQKQESRKNGDGMGKGSDKGCPDCIFWCFHLLWIPFAVKIMCEL